MRFATFVLITLQYVMEEYVIMAWFVGMAMFTFVNVTVLLIIIRET